MPTWKFIAERVRTGKFLDLELPLVVDGPAWSLSAPASYKASISPEMARAVADDGLRLLEPWGTLIHAEADGSIRASGIVTFCEWDGAKWGVEIAGFSAYPFGIPYEADYRGAEIDPVQVIRDIWTWVQAQPGGDLGVKVVGSSDITIGFPSDIPLQAAKDAIAAAKKTKEATLKSLKATYEGPIDSLKSQLDAASAATDSQRDSADTVNAGLAATTANLQLIYQARSVTSAKKADELSKANTDLTAAQAAKTKAQANGWNTAKSSAEVTRLTNWISMINQYAGSSSSQIASAKAAYESARKTQTVRAEEERLKVEVKQTAEATIRKQKTKLEDEYAKKKKTAETVFDAANTPAQAALEKAQAQFDLDGGPYVISGADLTDCGTEIRQVAEASSVDFREYSYWNSTRTAVVKEIRAAYPRVGARRSDLIFSTDTNIIEQPKAEYDGDGWANVAIGVGAGEGSAALRANVSVASAKLRRVVIVDAKDVRSKSVLTSESKTALKKAQGLLTFPEVKVRSHPGTPIGSWSVGDDILIDVVVPHLGRQQIWHRVVGWTLDGDDRAVLQLVRSDQFGGV